MSAYLDNLGNYDITVSQVLFACVTNPKAASYAAEKLDAVDFVNQHAKVLFSEIKQAVVEGEEVDIAKIAEARPQAHEYLIEQTEQCLSSLNYETYVDALRPIKRRLDMWGMASQLNEMLQRQDSLEDIEGMVNLTLAERETAVTGKARAMSEIVLPWFKSFKERCENETGLRGISTGFSSLDEVTTGLCGENLITLAARPAMGKSMFALNLALSATKQSKNVLFVSLEMTAEEIADRLASNICEVDGKLIRNGMAGEAGQVKKRVLDKIGGGIGRMRETKLHIIDGQDLRPDSLVLAVQRHYREFGCDLVIIEYLGLLVKGENDKVRALGDASRDFKMLATSLDIPVIQLHQVNRDCEKRQNKRPQLSDLRASGEIEEHSNMVMFLYREDAYVKDYAKHDNKLEVLIEKNRSGATGTVTLGYDFRYMRLSEHAVPNFDEGAA